MRRQAWTSRRSSCRLTRAFRRQRDKEVAADGLDRKRRTGRRQQIANLLLAIEKQIAAVAVTPLPLPGQRPPGLGKAEKSANARNVENTVDDGARVRDIVHETHYHRVIEALRQRI